MAKGLEPRQGLRRSPLCGGQGDGLDPYRAHFSGYLGIGVGGGKALCQRRCQSHGFLDRVAVGGGEAEAVEFGGQLGSVLVPEGAGK